MRFLAAAVAALALAGCSVPGLNAQPAAVAPSEPPLAHHPHEPDPSPRGVEPLEQDPLAETRREVDYTGAEAICYDGQRFAVAFTGYDAGLGGRWHQAQVRNCTDDELTLPDPVLHGRDLGNIWGEVTSEPAYGPEPSPTLGPGEAIGLELTWRSNGRCERGIQELRLRLGEQSFDSPENCLQLGGSYAPEGTSDIRWQWISK